MFGQELLDLRDVHGGQAVQDVSEVFLGVDSAPPATDDQRLDDGTTPARIGVVDEEPTAVPDRGHTDGVFVIIVDAVG